MSMKLSQLEEDFLGDLAQDSHELWEVYAFVRNHYAEAPEDEILLRGNQLLSTWVERGWLKVSSSRDNAVDISGDELIAEIRKLGPDAGDPKKGNIMLDITDRALSDVKWLAMP